jgi:hypothetical protein
MKKTWKYKLWFVVWMILLWTAWILATLWMLFVAWKIWKVVSLKVSCRKMEAIWETTIKTGEVLFQRNWVYIVSWNFVYKDLDESWNEMEIFGTWFYDAEPFNKDDCIRQDIPMKYIDKVERFKKLNWLYFE